MTPARPLLCAVLLFACGPAASPATPDAAADAAPPDAPSPDVLAPDAPSLPDAPAPDAPSPDAPSPDAAPDAVAARTWTLRTHPCPGPNRTDALLVEADGKLWVGCGSGADGAGLFRGAPDGAAWSQVRGTAVLDAFRVSSIERGPDGALYLGGYHAATRTMALRVDDRASPLSADAVLTGTTRLGTNFHVGTLRLRADGSALAESLTGTDVLWRPSAAAPWEDVASRWSSDGMNRQLLDLVPRGDRFVGCGSTIASAPFAFVPDVTAGAAPYRMTPVALSAAWTGELWGVAVAGGDRVVAVGEDQRNHRGKILVSGADPARAADWRETDLDAAARVTGWTWARGVCARGERVVVVGERQPLGAGTGLVVESNDGGATWGNVTPAGVSASVSKCAILADGTLVVAGAAGQVGFYR